MLGVLALLLAAGAAFWMLYRVGRGDRGAAGGQKRAVFILKLVVWFGIAAGLLAAKLLPLALMVLLAAGGVTAIELWRDRAIKANAGRDAPTPRPGAAAGPALALDEAAAVLGVAPDASADEIRAAHKRLIGQLHPDKGGSDYLAAKINDARRIMLARLGAAAHD